METDLVGWFTLSHACGSQSTEFLCLKTVYSDLGITIMSVCLAYDYKK